MLFSEINLERKYLNLFVRFLFKHRIYQEYLDAFKEGKIETDEITSPHMLIGAIRSNNPIWVYYYSEWRRELSKLNNDSHGK